jgi:hypothetical protein
VELVHAYSNLSREAEVLRRLRGAAPSQRSAGGSTQTRQNQRRLNNAEVGKLIREYEEGALVKELAGRFGIHRLTVTALLRQHGVKLRRVGLAPDDIPAAGRLYAQGWSLARLGAEYGVDSTTVWRALLAAGVAMRNANNRPT